MMFPVRCSMGGGPAGCFRVIGHHHDAVQKAIEENKSWSDIFKSINVTDKCCMQSIQNFSWYYDQTDFASEFTRNKLGSDENAVWSLRYSDEPSYAIPPRVYQLNALKGPVFEGYRLGDAVVKSVKDVDDKKEEIYISTDEQEENMLLEKHLEAIRSIEQLPSFSRQRV